VLTTDQARVLMESIDTSALVGLRDRALIGVMTYAFALAPSSPCDRRTARLWKMQLQKLADATGLTLVVCHYPPGTPIILRPHAAIPPERPVYRPFCGKSYFCCSLLECKRSCENAFPSWRGSCISRQYRRIIKRLDHRGSP
jgi:hypothetical protein